MTKRTYDLQSFNTSVRKGWAMVAKYVEQEPLSKAEAIDKLNELLRSKGFSDLVLDKPRAGLMPSYSSTYSVASKDAPAGAKELFFEAVPTEEGAGILWDLRPQAGAYDSRRDGQAASGAWHSAQDSRGVAKAIDSAIKSLNEWIKVREQMQFEQKRDEQLAGAALEELERTADARRAASLTRLNDVLRSNGFSELTLDSPAQKAMRSSYSETVPFYHATSSVAGHDNSGDLRMLFSVKSMAPRDEWYWYVSSVSEDSLITAKHASNTWRFEEEKTPNSIGWAIKDAYKKMEKDSDTADNTADWLEESRRAALNGVEPFVEAAERILSSYGWVRSPRKSYESQLMYDSNTWFYYKETGLLLKDDLRTVTWSGGESGYIKECTAYHVPYLAEPKETLDKFTKSVATATRLVDEGVAKTLSEKTEVTSGTTSELTEAVSKLSEKLVAKGFSSLQLDEGSTQAGSKGHKVYWSTYPAVSNESGKSAADRWLALRAADLWLAVTPQEDKTELRWEVGDKDEPERPRTVVDGMWKYEKEPKELLKAVDVALKKLAERQRRDDKAQKAEQKTAAARKEYATTAADKLAAAAVEETHAIYVTAMTGLLTRLKEQGWTDVSTYGNINASRGSGSTFYARYELKDAAGEIFDIFGQRVDEISTKLNWRVSNNNGTKLFSGVWNFKEYPTAILDVVNKAPSRTVEARQEEELAKKQEELEALERQEQWEIKLWGKPGESAPVAPPYDVMAAAEGPFLEDQSMREAAINGLRTRLKAQGWSGVNDTHAIRLYSLNGQYEREDVPARLTFKGVTSRGRPKLEWSVRNDKGTALFSGVWQFHEYPTEILAVVSKASSRLVEAQQEEELAEQARAAELNKIELAKKQVLLDLIEKQRKAELALWGKTEETAAEPQGEREVAHLNSTVVTAEVTSAEANGMFDVAITGLFMRLEAQGWANVSRVRGALLRSGDAGTSTFVAKYTLKDVPDGKLQLHGLWTPSTPTELKWSVVNDNGTKLFSGVWNLNEYPTEILALIDKASSRLVEVRQEEELAEKSKVAAAKQAELDKLEKQRQAELALWGRTEAAAAQAANARETTLRAEGFVPYTKNATVWARAEAAAFAITSDKGDLTAQAGDYQVTDGKKRTWPVAKDIFETTHEWVTHPVELDRSDLREQGYAPARKTAPVWAKVLTQDETIETLEGPRQAKAGDWLAVGVANERWPIPDSFFAENYVQNDAQATVNSAPTKDAAADADAGSNNGEALLKKSVYIIGLDEVARVSESGNGRAVINSATEEWAKAHPELLWDPSKPDAQEPSTHERMTTQNFAPSTEEEKAHAAERKAKRDERIAAERAARTPEENEALDAAKEERINQRKAEAALREEAQAAERKANRATNKAYEVDPQVDAEYAEEEAAHDEMLRAAQEDESEWGVWRAVRDGLSPVKTFDVISPGTETYVPEKMITAEFAPGTPEEEARRADRKTKREERIAAQRATWTPERTAAHEAEKEERRKQREVDAVRQQEETAAHAKRVAEGQVVAADCACNATLYVAASTTAQERGVAVKAFFKEHEDHDYRAYTHGGAPGPIQHAGRSGKDFVPTEAMGELGKAFNRGSTLVVNPHLGAKKPDVIRTRSAGEASTPSAKEDAAKTIPAVSTTATSSEGEDWSTAQALQDEAAQAAMDVESFKPLGIMGKMGAAPKPAAAQSVSGEAVRNELHRLVQDVRDELKQRRESTEAAPSYMSTPEEIARNKSAIEPKTYVAPPSKYTLINTIQAEWAAGNLGRYALSLKTKTTPERADKVRANMEKIYTALRKHTHSGDVSLDTMLVETLDSMRGAKFTPEPNARAEADAGLAGDCERLSRQLATYARVFEGNHGKRS